PTARFCWDRAYVARPQVGCRFRISGESILFDLEAVFGLEPGLPEPLRMPWDPCPAVSVHWWRRRYLLDTLRLCPLARGVSLHRPASRWPVLSPPQSSESFLWDREPILLAAPRSFLARTLAAS